MKLTAINIKQSLFLFSFFLLTGCATGYYPESGGLGYGSRQLGKNLFDVYFKGNGRTGSQRAYDFALLRAAELTIENRYRYFAVLGSSEGNTQSFFKTPIQVETTYNTTTSGTFSKGFSNSYNESGYGNANSEISGGDLMVINNPYSVLKIKLFYKKTNTQNWFRDARDIKETMCQKYDYWRSFREMLKLPKKQCI